MSPEKKFLIWSEEHGAWWMAAAGGYTRSILAAGRYSAEEAEAIVGRANMYMNTFEVVNEVAIPEPSLPTRTKMREG